MAPTPISRKGLEKMKSKTDVPNVGGMQLRAGVGKADITNTAAGPANDPLYAKALVLKDEATTAAVVTVDAVAIAEIGSIRNEYLSDVRARLERELDIPPENVVINASHCHGSVCPEVAERTVQAVKEAVSATVPVTVGAGNGREDRIMENRRLRLKDGGEADVRRAYSVVPDGEVVGVGPVDPEIGILRLDRREGGTLAVIYNFACHPIQGVPGGGNSADLTGFASRVIEDHLGGGALALFLQGCAGDVNPIRYKAVDDPPDAETLGNMLGMSALRGLERIRCGEAGPLKVIRETVALPRADLSGPIEALLAEQARVLGSLKATTLNLKQFLPLLVKHRLTPEYPSYDSHRYLHERQMGRDDLARMDAANRSHLERYIENIHAMEKLTRIQTNLNLLKKHYARNLAAGKDTLEVEMVGLRVGDFVLLTFPGELSVQIGLNVKEKSPHDLTFLAGVTNGYIYYSPTAEQLENRGGAQEDSDCVLAPEWQAMFEAKALEMLGRL
jgi:hypothetical protein